MNIHLILLLGFFALAGIVAILVGMFKFGFLKCLSFSLISGVGALLLLHFTSLMSGISLVVNWYSLAVSALGGLPAVVGMVVLSFKF